VHSAEEGRHDKKYPEDRRRKMKTYIGLSLVLVALSLSSVGQVFASSPGFSLTSSCDQPYVCGTDVVTVASLNGFSGTVNLSTSVKADNCTQCTLNASMSPSSVSVTAGGNATSTLELSGISCHPSPGHLNCQWTITITGKSHSISNSTQVFECVGNSCPI
jgi:hypothetical protein